MDLQTDKNTFTSFFMLVFFAAAFGYIEATVVVYLRGLFYPAGFVFPIADFVSMAGAKKILLIEIGREIATLVLVFTASYLLGRDLPRRIAYFLSIFAVWDIFYYIWLKVLLDWPASITDWDVLFLIPITWAGPVLAPVITSLTMLLIAFWLFSGRNIMPGPAGKIGLAVTAIMIVVCFCIAGLKITTPEYKSYFNWPVFLILHAIIITLLFRSRRKT